MSNFNVLDIFGKIFLLLGQCEILTFITHKIYWKEIFKRFPWF